MVCGVMDGVVTNIAEDQTGKDRRSNSAKDDGDQQIEEEREGDTHHRRHNQPAGIVRIIVMNAVDHKVQKFSQTSFRFIMKDAPVNNVFQKGPDQDAEGKQRANEKNRKPPLPQRLIKKIADDREINDQWGGRMNVGKKLHETALEHPHAFVLI